MIEILLWVLVIVVIASLIVWAIRSAPEQVIAGTFKQILCWAVVVIAVILVVLQLLKAFRIAIAGL